MTDHRDERRSEIRNKTDSMRSISSTFDDQSINAQKQGEEATAHNKMDVGRIDDP